MIEIIKNLQVRGAPLIGVAAVLQLALYAEQGATMDDIHRRWSCLARGSSHSRQFNDAMDRVLHVARESEMAQATARRRRFLPRMSPCARA